MSGPKPLPGKIFDPHFGRSYPAPNDGPPKPDPEIVARAKAFNVHDLDHLHAEDRDHILSRIKGSEPKPSRFGKR